MPLLDYKLVRVDPALQPARRRRGATATFWAFAAIGAAAFPACADTLSRSVDVAASPAAVWRAIGPFCAIAEWHPAIATCAVDGKVPPTRTLTTRDKATFVEMQTERDDAHRFYSYTFVSSPLPVTNYQSTLKVIARRAGGSTVTWSGQYAVGDAQARAAKTALEGIYESGLAAIKAKLGR